MADNRRVYHVVPASSADKGLITQERLTTEFRTKAEAALAAKPRTRMQEPLQVKFHGNDGNTGIREHLWRRSGACPELARDRDARQAAQALDLQDAYFAYSRDNFRFEAPRQAR